MHALENPARLLESPEPELHKLTTAAGPWWPKPLEIYSEILARANIYGIVHNIKKS